MVVDRCHDQAVLEGGQQGAVLEKSRIPLYGESLPANVKTRAVERKDNQKQDRYVEKRKDQRGPESEDPALHPRGTVLFRDARPPGRSRRGRHCHALDVIGFLGCV